MHARSNKAPAWLRQEWGTPQWLFDKVNEQFTFTIDAAARHHNAKLPRYWTKEDNGLSLPWAGQRVWCNPPYNDVGAWLSKGCLEILEGDCDLAVFLVPAALDVQWFEIASLGRVEPFRGRIQFEEPPELTAWREENGIKKSGAAGGVMLVVYEKGHVKDYIPETVTMRFRDARTGEFL